MEVPGEGSTFRNVFYALGYALGEGEARRGGRTTAPPEAHAVPSDAAAEPATEAAAAALGAAAGAWLITRLFRPRRVNWPRAVAAGIAGTALMKMAETIEDRLRVQASDGSREGSALAPAATVDGLGPGGGTESEGLETQARASHAGATAPLPIEPMDYAAGIATAAAYGAILYPRLPGSPTTRALVFSALEAAASGVGGTFGVLRRVAPGLALPLEALAPPGLHGRGPLPTLAFGLGLGLYRDGTDDDA